MSEDFVSELKGSQTKLENAILNPEYQLDDNYWPEECEDNGCNGDPGNSGNYPSPGPGPGAGNDPGPGSDEPCDCQVVPVPGTREPDPAPPVDDPEPPGDDQDGPSDGGFIEIPFDPPGNSSAGSEACKNACYVLYIRIDVPICNRMSNARARAICHAAMAAKLGVCNAEC